MSDRKSVVCPICGVTPKDQHSNRESGICDGIRHEHLDRYTRQPIKKTDKAVTHE